MKAKELTLDIINENFYESEGILYKKGSSKKEYSNKCGYFDIRFNEIYYKVHRILWVLYNQESIPEGYVVDHKDCDKTNNKKDNLRLATPKQNSYNSKTPKHNTSGIKGISKKRIKNYYVYKASVYNGKERIAKYFSYDEIGLKEAKNWLEFIREKLHGEFARSC